MQILGTMHSTMQMYYALLFKNINPAFVLFLIYLVTILDIIYKTKIYK